MFAFIDIGVFELALITGVCVTTAFERRVIPCLLNASTIALSLGVPLLKSASLSSAYKTSNRISVYISPSFPLDHRYHYHMLI